MKYFVIFLVLIGLSTLIIPQTFGVYVEFENSGYKLLVNNKHIVNFQLDWDSENLPSGEITFDESINETILLQIPKSIPRITNLDFGHFSLFALQTDGSSPQIRETDSECFYILEIPVNDSDHIEIFGASVAAGRWEPVSILNQSCGEFSLKQQIENKMSVDEIECKNEKHILVERVNEQLACVYPFTAEQLGWKIINADSTMTPLVFEVVKDNKIFDVKYTIKGSIVQDMIYDTGESSILITMDAVDKGILTITIPRILIDAKLDYCPPQKGNSPDDMFFVLVNEGVYDFGIGYKEIFYKEILTTSESRTLEIAFLQNTTNIQIIGSCFL